LVCYLKMQVTYFGTRKTNLETLNKT
jgi:hypothetical protein